MRLRNSCRFSSSNVEKFRPHRSKARYKFLGNPRLCAEYVLRKRFIHVFTCSNEMTAAFLDRCNQLLLRDDRVSF